MKLEIDERGGCIAVVDADKRGDDNGLGPDKSFVLWYEAGVWVPRFCDKCGHEHGGQWDLRDGASGRAAAAMLRLSATDGRKEDDNG